MLSFHYMKELFKYEQLGIAKNTQLTGFERFVVGETNMALLVILFVMCMAASMVVATSINHSTCKPYSHHPRQFVSKGMVDKTLCYREIQCLCSAASPTKAGSYLRNKQIKTTFVFLYKKQIRGEQRRPTSVLRLVPCLIPLPSNRSLPLVSSSTQLQIAPVESKQHNTIQEQRSTIINNIGPDIH